MKFIDISLDIEDKMTSFSAPWHPDVQVVQMGDIKEVGRNSRKMVLGTHTGTHTDAPLHFIEEGPSIDTIPLERYVGSVSIVDFSHLDRSDAVTVDMLKSVPITERMIFFFGHDKYWGTETYFKEYPFFTVEAVAFLIANGLKLIGMDTCSPDDPKIAFGSDRDSECHKLFLKNDVLILEYLCNIGSVRELDGWNISCVPLKIKGADGSPVRAFLFK